MEAVESRGRGRTPSPSMASDPGARQSHQIQPIPLDGEPEGSPPSGPRPSPRPPWGHLWRGYPWCGWMERMGGQSKVGRRRRRKRHEEAQ